MGALSVLGRSLIWSSVGLLTISTVFFAVGTGTPSWIKFSSAGVSARAGLWRGCTTPPGQSETCNGYTGCQLDPASASTTGPIANTNSGDCGDFSTVKAFSIIATVTSGLALLIMLLVGVLTWNTILLPVSVYLMVGLSAISGLISMSIYVHEAKNLPSSYSYGYSFGLFTAAWCVNIILMIAPCIPGSGLFYGGGVVAGPGAAGVAVV